MKKKNIYFLGIAILLSGCAESIVDTDSKKGDENLNSQSTTTFIGGTEKTRTSLNMTYPGGTQVNYFWEPGDKIWTADGISGEADITATAPTARFKLPKMYTSSTITVYYPGNNATSYNEVVIPKDQNQNGANSTEKFGDNGDCGTATAQKRADGSYQFNLDHKATVLCFLPYTHNNYDKGDHYVPRVISIKVTSDDNIAGSYTLTPSGLTGSGTEKSIKLSLDYDAAALSPNTPNQALSAAYMVIAPGTHTLKVEYTLKAWTNLNGYVEGVVTKTINTHTYLPNMVYPIEVDLTLKDFSDKKDQFYMWDARYNYWYNAATGTQYDNIPVFEYNSRNDYPNSLPNPADGRTHSPSTTAAVNSCRYCPTFAAATWYAYAGDPYYDDKNPWFYNGYMCVGGAWLKKWNYITAPDAYGNTKSTIVPYNNYQQDQGDASYPRITMKRGQPAGALWDSKNGELASSEYFYLPYLAFFNFGQYSTGSGCYWTSTPYRNGNERKANSIFLTKGFVEFNRSMVPSKQVGQQIWTMK